MHPKFLEILCCPKTGAELRLKVDEVFADGSIKSGSLATLDGQYVYPIIKGIPRFVGRENYTNSFGYEWKKWSRVQFESENAGGPMAGHTERMFDAVTGFSPHQMKGKLVVEFGCGPGRFLDIVRRRGGIAVGIDMSIAVEPARENFAGDKDVLIVQGDVFEPPFKRGTFDLGYSIGVLHHTPDPARGLKSLARVVRKDGSIACCVYPKDQFYDYPSVAMYRKIHNSVKSIAGNKLALGYSYFSAHVLYHCFNAMRRIPKVRGTVPLMERYVFVNLDIPDARWRVLDVFDAITPFYASTHTPEDVCEWFERANCHKLIQRPWGTTAFVAVRGDEAEEYSMAGEQGRSSSLESSKV
jgi:SAM-dependent methyltransferase